MTEYNVVVDSGDRTEFETGSVRDARQGKGRYDLFPNYALHRLAQHFENGALKYGIDNWRKGMPLSTYLDSAFRHTNKLLAGLNDEDHASAAIWNLMCYIETVQAIREGILPEELNDVDNSLKPQIF